MSGIIIYELPEDKEIAAKIVDLFPLGCWIHGHLVATQELYAKNEIAEDTALVIGRDTFDIVSRKEQPFEREESGMDQSSHPRIVDVLARKKLFSSIYFRDAGFMSNKIRKGAHDLASEFIRIGYKGNLDIPTDFVDNASGHNPETFVLSHYSNEVRLSWYSEYSGHKEKFESIEKDFKNLGVKKLSEGDSAT
jgi:hypothetical protein